MVSTCLAGCKHFQVCWAPARTPAPAPMGRQAGRGGTEYLVGGDGGVRMPKTCSLLSQQGWLCLAGTRQLRAVQGISDAGSCRAQAGQATHAWQPAHGAISVHRRMGRALQAVIASLSPPGGRKMTPSGLRTLPCRCSAHFCSTTEHPSSSGSWPSQHLSSHSPTAAPRFPQSRSQSSPQTSVTTASSLTQSSTFPGVRTRAHTPRCKSPAQHPPQ